MLLKRVVKNNVYLLFVPGVTQKLFNAVLGTNLNRGMTSSNTVMMNCNQYIRTEKRYI